MINKDTIWGYKPDGIMVVRGDLLRWKDEPDKAYTISTISQDGIQIDYWSGADKFPFRVIAEDCEYSKDGGQTWFACNKLMTQSAADCKVTVMTKRAGGAPVQPKNPVWLEALFWIVSPLFLLAILILSIPGALAYLLEPPIRKVMR